MSNGKPDAMQAISEKLDVILAFMMVKDLKGDLGLIVPRLKTAGMSTKTIALVAGVTERAVQLRLQGAKAGGKPKKKKKKAAATSATPLDEGSADGGSGKSVDPAS